MPPLTRTVEKLDTVPEPFRPLYIANEAGDGFVLDPEQIEGVEDTTALKSALNKERAHGKTMAKLKKALGTEEVDPDEIAELVRQARLSAGDTKGARKHTDDEITRLLEKARKEVRDELAPQLTASEKLAKRVRALTVGVQAREAFVKAGGHKTAIADAEALSERYLSVDEKTEKVVVLDDDGDPTTMTVEKFFAGKFKQLKPHLYDGTGSSGSDAEKTTKTKAGDAAAGATPLSKIQRGLEQRANARR